MPDTAAIDALLEGLNEPQRDAVTHGEGPLLILAGAGSGKTRVLTHRIAYLLRTGQARASEILAITFTNKAAQEMRERVELLVGRATRAMWVMTFHSACARMLRADAHRLGYTRQFTIYDAADSRRLIKKCLDDLDIDVKRFTPRAMQCQISDAKNKLRSAEDYRQLVGSFFEQTVADVYEHYEREIHRMNAMDFDDLLFRAVNLLELFQEVRDRYSTAFRWILVDEYQDTNHAQYRWLQLLASEHRNLAVVGDDEQCDLRLPRRRHPATSSASRRTSRTPTSSSSSRTTARRRRSSRRPTRSSPTTAAGREGAVDRRSARATRSGSGSSRDEHAEARFVAAEIERMVDEGVSRSEIAVFYRTNAQSRVLEDMLVRAQIGYQVIGGTKFYDRAEIKDAIAYLTSSSTRRTPARSRGSPTRRSAGSGRRRSRACSRTRTRWASRCGTRRRARTSVPALGTAAQKALGRFMCDDGAAARARRVAARRSARCCRRR